MKSIWFLDYLDMLYIQAGYFETEEDALQWVDDNDPDRLGYYKTIEVPEANRIGTTGRTYRNRYATQR